MKIIQLTAENIKKLKVIDITPVGDFIEITGKNASGKSSILDSIWYALAGQSVIPGQPIRTGQDHANVRLDLGEITVERRFTPNGTTIVVESKDGKRFKSPQAVLDELVGQLAFDPLEFSRMKPREQYDMLRAAAKIDLDFDALAKADAEDYERRRDINREVKSLESQLAAIKVPAYAPDEKVDTIALIERLNEIEARNRRVEKTQAELNATKQSRLKTIQSIEALQRQLAEFDAKIADAVIPERLDPAATKAKLAGAEAANEAWRAKTQAFDMRVRIKSKTDQSEACSTRMQERAEKRTAALESANMPVPGLSLADGVILMNGVPFEQASSAEQLRTSVAIAMAANPKLRIIRIKDGGLLDEDGIRILQEMTAGAGYQAWVEKVDSSGKVGIYLEDGSVVANNYELQPAGVADEDDVA